MTVKNADFIGLGRVNIFGQPYHGLWQSGAITLPNATTKGGVTPANGGCVLIRVPGVQPVTRTPAEAAADTAAGFDWRTYALISGGYYGGIGPFFANDARAYVIFVDAANVRWLLRFEQDTFINKLKMQARRLCHIGGPAEAWSSYLTLTMVPAVFLSAAHPVTTPLLTIAQNTTGRQFVLGCLPDGGYSEALLQMDITGTLNVTQPNFGLTITPTLLEYPFRYNVVQTATESVTGKCYVITTYNCIEKDSSSQVPTGRTYTRIETYTDGVYSDNGSPPSPGPNAYWDWGLPSFTFNATKTKTASGATTAEKIVWAAYLEDTLVLYKLVYSESWSYATNPAHWVDNGSTAYTFYGYWAAGGTGSYTYSLKSMIGATVVHDHSRSQSAPPSEQFSFGPQGLSFPADSQDGYTNSESTNLSQYKITSQMITDAATELQDGGGNTTGWTVTYFVPIKLQGQRWSSPLFVLCERYNSVATPQSYAFTPQQVWAPSGTHQSTSLSLNGLYATWHPVLDDLRVANSPVCWF